MLEARARELQAEDSAEGRAYEANHKALLEQLDKLSPSDCLPFDEKKLEPWPSKKGRSEYFRAHHYERIEKRLWKGVPVAVWTVSLGLNRPKDSVAACKTVLNLF